MMKNSPSLGRQQVDFTQLRKQLDAMPSNLKNILNLFVRSDDNSETRSDGEQRLDIPKLTTLSKIISDNITAASDLRQITPYISKAEIIWKSLLLYPNGFQERIFSYDTEDTKYKNASLYNELASKVEDFFTNVYKIEEMAVDVIPDVMFITGSYMQLNITRTALDNLINGASKVRTEAGLESFEIETNGLLKYEPNSKRLLLRNNGLVSRSRGNTVAGLESLFKGSINETEYEFSLFEDEELAKLTNITITDNISALGIKEVVRKQTKNIKFKVDGTEALETLIETQFNDNKAANEKPNAKAPVAKINNLNLAQLEALQNNLLPKRDVTYMPFQRIREDDYYEGSVGGDALSIHVPSNAVALIRSQNRIQGAYLLIDTNGCFVTNVAEQTYYQKERDNLAGFKQNATAGNTDVNNALITSLKLIKEGKTDSVDLSEFTKLSKNMIVREMISAVVSGQGEDVTMELTPDFLEIMLARMFKQQQTRCLYVPASTFTYFAIQYNPNTGAGESLTEQAKQFISRLAALDIADAIANLEASQPHNLMEITPEREDGDPIATSAMARAAWFSMNPTVHDIVGNSLLSIPDITDRLKEQSLTIRVNNSENNMIPAPQIDVSQNEKVGFKAVDQDSRNSVLNNIANTFGLQRSWLDTAEDANNFAVEVLAEQEMLRNRTVMYSNLFSRHFSDLVRKHTRVNQTLLTTLIETIKNADAKLRKPDHGDPIEGDEKKVVATILKDFIKSIKVVLPSPASIESTNKLKDKIEAVNELVKSWIEMSGSKTVFNQLLSRYGIKPINGELDENDKEGNEQLEVLEAVYRMIAYKRFNIPMPFDEIMNRGKEGGIYSLMDDVRQYVNNGTLFTVEFLSVLKQMDKDFSKAAKKHKLLVENSDDQEDTTNDFSNEEDTVTEPVDDSLENDFEDEKLGDDFNDLEEDETEIKDDLEEEEDTKETEVDTEENKK